MSEGKVDLLPMLLRAQQDAIDAQKKTLGLMESRLAEFEALVARYQESNQKLTNAVAVYQQREAAAAAAKEAESVAANDNIEADESKVEVVDDTASTPAE